MRKYTPNNLDKLNEMEVFVFGSNAEGKHGKGAALLAVQKFGAIYGQAQGLQGQSYAIITKKNWRVPKSSTLTEISFGIEKFLKFAKQNYTLTFYVTKLGSSLAGYTIEEIRDLFLDAHIHNMIPDNVILPEEYEVRDIKLTYTASEVELLLQRQRKKCLDCAIIIADEDTYLDDTTEMTYKIDRDSILNAKINL